MAASPTVQFPILPLIRLMGIASALLVVFWCVYFRGGLALFSDNKDLIFNVHPVLTIIGFIFLNGEGILAFKTMPGARSSKKAAHMRIQFLALLLGLFGVWAAFKFHNDKGIDHFYSLHSWFGIACVLLFAFQWIGGFVNFWSSGGSASSRALMLPWHVFLGAFLYVLAVLAAATGLLEKATFLQGSKVIGRYSAESFLINILGVLLVLLGGSVVLAIISGTGKADAKKAASN